MALKTFTADALLILSKTFIADAQLVIRHTKTFTADAELIYSREYLVSQCNVRMAEIFEIALANGVTHYYTNHNDDLIWGTPSQTYLSCPGIERGPIRRESNLEATTCDISLANISSQLRNVLEGNILEASMITIKQVFWDETYRAGLESTLFVGRPQANYNRKQMTLACVSTIDALTLQIPRRSYQDPCNSILFDCECKLTRATYVYSGMASADSANRLTVIDSDMPVRSVAFDAGDSTNPISIGDIITGGIGGGTANVIQIVYLTVTTGTIWYNELVLPDFINNEVLTAAGDTVTVNGTPAEDTSFYELGEIKMTSGNNNGQRRMVRATDDDVIHLAWGLPYDVLNGETFEIYPGCDLRPETCNDRFNNKTNFTGFPYIPKIEETIM